MRRTRLGLVGSVLVAGVALAQSSTSFRLDEHAFNAGGNPAGGTILTSAGFRTTLDSVGDSVSARDLGSASFRMDASFATAYPPPGEVTGLRFTGTMSLVWDPERSVGVYDLYRDLTSQLAGLGFGLCEQQDLVGAAATEADAPPVGSGYFYLVTARNRLDEEGTKGFQSSGAERGNAAPCP